MVNQFPVTLKRWLKITEANATLESNKEAVTMGVRMLAVILLFFLAETIQKVFFPRQKKVGLSRDVG